MGNGNRILLIWLFAVCVVFLVFITIITGAHLLLNDPGQDPTEIQFTETEVDGERIVKVQVLQYDYSGHLNLVVESNNRADTEEFMDPSNPGGNVRVLGDDQGTTFEPGDTIRIIDVRDNGGKIAVYEVAGKDQTIVLRDD